MFQMKTQPFLFVNHTGGGNPSYDRTRRRHIVQNVRQRRGNSSRSSASSSLKQKQGALGAESINEANGEQTAEVLDITGGLSSRTYVHEFNTTLSSSTESLHLMYSRPVPTYGPGDGGDPFDVFPLKLTDEAYELLQWHFWSPYHGMPGTPNHMLVVDYMKQHYKASFWDYSKDDLVLLYTLLSAAAIKRAINSKRTDTLFLHYRTEALAAIAQRLQVLKDSMDDNTAIAIANQALFAIVDEDEEVATLHMKTLSTMWTNDTTTFTAARIIGYCDLKVATALFRHPQLPCRPLMEPIGAGLPSGFKLATATLTSLTMQHINLLHESALYAGCKELMEKLHSSTRLLSERGLNVPTIINEKFACTYRICDVAASAQIAAEAQTSSSTIFSCLTLAAELFQWTSLRHFHAVTIIQRPLFLRLREKMSTCVNIIDMWEREVGLALLLWVLATGSICTLVVGSHHVTEYQWYLENTKGVIQALNVTTFAEFAELLGHFPWADHLCSRRYPVIWAQMFDRAEAVLEPDDFDLVDIS